MQRFDGCTIVLTGVGREGQLGEIVARAFAEEGAALTLVDRDGHEAHERASTLRQLGFTAHGEECDLTDPAQVQALAGDVAQRHGGRVDALVNIAGGFAMSGPVGESDVTVWRRQFDINLTTAYLATRAFLPQIRTTRGAIVYFASAAVLPGGNAGGMSAYVAAKSGVLALARAVAEEERDAGVRANAIAPTSIRTAANLRTMSKTAEYVEREEVAATVLFLCSEAASAVTGQVLRLA
jgi:NAD(P)-dependent dehydrogenase (short-subunit alcohol dehydrogenase family)